MIVNAPPNSSAVTLWVMSKMERWTPSSGLMRYFFSLAATGTPFHFRHLSGLSYPRSEARCAHWRWTRAIRTSENSYSTHSGE